MERYPCYHQNLWMEGLVGDLESKRECDGTSRKLSLTVRLAGVKQRDEQLNKPCRELKPSTPESLLAREGAEVSHQHRPNQNRCPNAVPA